VRLIRCGSQRSWNRRRAGIAFLLAAPLRGQPLQTFRAETRLVRVDAEVLEDGRVLSGFGKDDFRVLDDSKPQTICHFSAGEDPPRSDLIVDVSGSMGIVVAAVAAAAHEGLQELRAGDRVCIMTFNTKSQEVAGFTEDLDAVQKTIEENVLRTRFGGFTLIQASVDDAALRFLREPKGERRRAVLIITDNMGIRTRREQKPTRYSAD